MRMGGGRRRTGPLNRKGKPTKHRERRDHRARLHWLSHAAEISACVLLGRDGVGVRGGGGRTATQSPSSASRSVQSELGQTARALTHARVRAGRTSLSRLLGGRASSLALSAPHCEFDVRAARSRRRRRCFPFLLLRRHEIESPSRSSAKSPRAR